MKVERIHTPLPGVVYGVKDKPEGSKDTSERVGAAADSTPQHQGKQQFYQTTTPEQATKEDVPAVATADAVPVQDHPGVLDITV